jgi:hypothetical protein
MGSRGRGEGRTAEGKTRTDYCRPGGGGSYRSSRSCGGHCLSETVKGVACPHWVTSGHRRSEALCPLCAWIGHSVRSRRSDASCLRRSASGGDLAGIDPTPLRSRGIGRLHPTFFAPYDSEFGALCNHADYSR